MNLLAWVIALATAIDGHPSVTTSGTIVLTYFTRDRIIVLADSRIHHMNPESFSNDGCKVIALAPNWFFFKYGSFATVTDEHGGLLADAFEYARAAFRNRKNNANSAEAAPQVANEWAERTAATLNELLKIAPEQIIKKDTTDLGGGMFGIAHPSHLAMYWVRFSWESNAGGAKTATFSIRELLPVDGHPVGGYGYYEGVAEILANQTARARRWTASFRKKAQGLPASRDVLFLQSAADAVIKWAPAVEQRGIGKPFDVLVLPRGGNIKWLDRKCTCYVSDIDERN